MNRRMMTALLVAMAISVGSGSMLVAHPGHEHKILGTVTMAAANHVMMKDPEGKDHTIQINAATKFVQAKKEAKASDMKVGMRVVVTAETDEDDALIAMVIELGPATAAK